MLSVFYTLYYDGNRLLRVALPNYTEGEVASEVLKPAIEKLLPNYNVNWFQKEYRRVLHKATFKATTHPQLEAEIVEHEKVVNLKPLPEINPNYVCIVCEFSQGEGKNRGLSVMEETSWYTNLLRKNLRTELTT